jgi:hypothetical protein
MMLTSISGEATDASASTDERARHFSHPLGLLGQRAVLLGRERISSREVEGQLVRNGLLAPDIGRGFFCKGGVISRQKIGQMHQ